MLSVFCLFICFFVNCPGWVQLLRRHGSACHPAAVFPSVRQEPRATPVSSIKSSSDGRGVCGFPNADSSDSKCLRFALGSISPPHSRNHANVAVKYLKSAFFWFPERKKNVAWTYSSVAYNSSKTRDKYKTDASLTSQRRMERTCQHRE